MQNFKKNLMSQFWAIYKKVDFSQLLHPLFLFLTRVWGKQVFFHESDIILNILQHSIFTQKIYKNDWTVQKI